MNDTNKQVLQVFKLDTTFSSSQVHEQLPEYSLVTIKRRLSELHKAGLLVQSGAGRSVTYKLSKDGLMLRPIDPKLYLNLGPDNREGRHSFNFDLFEKPYVNLFSNDDTKILNKATRVYIENSKKSDANIRNKELLRFIIEFSWKTSQIEGNTYDLISTERLIRYGEKSKTNTEFEAQMILNQKEALEYIFKDLSTWKEPSVSQLENLHKIVSKNLAITKNIRKGLVGITGTNYRPIDNEFQIREALEQLFNWIKSTNNIYEKSFLSVIGISYIQPFADGNKRTSRLLSNAILLSDGLAPLSYRSVDDREYKEAMLIFYEQNSIEVFKKIFIEQYVFAANNYNIATV